MTFKDCYVCGSGKRRLTKGVLLSNKSVADFVSLGVAGIVKVNTVLCLKSIQFINAE